MPTAYGASDNASGVAALLYAAQALKDVPTDTQVRFISFTDEENGKNGSRAYTASLTEEEKDRMIGDIQFDMLGGLGSDGTLVCTMDGEANWVSDLLQEKDPSLERGAETASDHASLQLAGVPSVLLMQNGEGYLYHTAADTADQLDLYAIASAAETAVEAAEEICSPEYRLLPGTGPGTGGGVHLPPDPAERDLFQQLPLGHRGLHRRGRGAGGQLGGLRERLDRHL